MFEALAKVFLAIAHRQHRRRRQHRKDEEQGREKVHVY
jgi:hypothetical protein